jgi:hypothetical protein
MGTSTGTVERDYHLADARMTETWFSGCRIRRVELPNALRKAVQRVISSRYIRSQVLRSRRERRDRKIDGRRYYTSVVYLERLSVLFPRIKHSETHAHIE